MIDKTFGVFYFYDTESIVYPQKNLAKVWVRMFRVEKGQTFPEDIVKDKRPYRFFEKEKMPYASILFEISCSERRYKFIKIFMERKEHESDDPKLYKSSEILPEGTFHTLWKFVCPKIR